MRRITVKNTTTFTKLNKKEMTISILKLIAKLFKEVCARIMLKKAVFYSFLTQKYKACIMVSSLNY